MGPKKEGLVLGKLTGKITPSKLTVKLNKNISRTSFLSILNGDNNYLLGIEEIWRNKDGLYADLRVIGDLPESPFENTAEIRAASEDEIESALKLDVSEEKNLLFGQLLSTEIEANFNIEKLGRLFITGKSGSGKSHTVGVIVEELIKKQVPILIIDRHGEYSSLKVLVKNFVPPKDPFFKTNELSHSFSRFIIEFGNLNFNPGVDLGLDYLIASKIENIISPNQCSIVNLRGLDLTEQHNLVDLLLTRIYEASTKRTIPPCFLFIDEAHELAGKKNSDVKEKVRLIAQEGRKFGVNLAVITQRPQALDVTLRAQAGTWIIHKLTDINDVSITVKSAEGLTKSDEDEIQNLGVGEAIVTGDISPLTPLMVKIRKRYTMHGGVGYNILDFVKKTDDIHKAEIIARLKKTINKTDLKDISVSKLGNFSNDPQLKKKIILLDDKNKILIKENSDLLNSIKNWKEKFKHEEKRAKDAIKIAEKLMNELKKK